MTWGMIELYFWWIVHMPFHRWSHRFAWCHWLCWKLIEVAEREDRWEFA